MIRYLQEFIGLILLMVAVYGMWVFVAALR